MIHQYVLPDPGEGLTEAEIITWRVAVGDKIAINDVLVEIETSKSLVELPSPFAGVVSKLLVAEGTTADVGTVIAEIDDGLPIQNTNSVPAPETKQADKQVPNLVGYGAKESTRSRRKKTPKPEDNSQTKRSFEKVNSAEQIASPSSTTNVSLEDIAQSNQSTTNLADTVQGNRAKPPVRKYAKELNIDITTVPGTGPAGLITREDIELAAGVGHHNSIIASNNFYDELEFTNNKEIPAIAKNRRVPIKGVRKATADNVKKSISTHVHVTEWVQIDITNTMDLVAEIKTRKEFSGLHVSPFLIYVKAVCLALQRNPDLNSSWDDKTQEIIYHEDINLGFAAATPRGLMVPNIKSAQHLTLLQLCQEINRLTAISRAGKLQPIDYSGGTFTITNVGVFGIDAGTPIINGTESAILCMGAISRRPWVIDVGATERIEPRWVTTIAISFDHRNIDGEQGSSFLNTVAEVLTQPAMGLLY